MWYLANEVVSRLGLQETVILIVATLLIVVYLLQMWRKRPYGILVRLSVWVPTLMALNAVRSGWYSTRELYSYLQQAGAINEAQRQLMFDQAIRGGIRTIVLGLVCSAILWHIGTRWQRVAEHVAS